MNIGKEIATARRGLNLTQEQLAEKLQVARQTVSKWESGLAVPETAKIPRLAEVLACSTDQLLGMETTGTIKMKPTENGYAVDWTEAYPILKRYQQEMDCAYYQERLMGMMVEVQEKYGYTGEDSMLALKDIFAQAYFKHMGLK